MNDRSVVLLATVAERDALNFLFYGLGNGPETFMMAAYTPDAEVAGWYAHALTDGFTANAYAELATENDGLEVSVKTGEQMTPEQHLDAMLLGLGWLRDNPNP